MSVISDDDLPFDRINEPDDLAEGAAEAWRQECQRWRDADVEELVEEIVRLKAHADIIEARYHAANTEILALRSSLKDEQPMTAKSESHASDPR